MIAAPSQELDPGCSLHTFKGPTILFLLFSRETATESIIMERAKIPSQNLDFRELKRTVLMRLFFSWERKRLFPVPLEKHEKTKYPLRYTKRLWKTFTTEGFLLVSSPVVWGKWVLLDLVWGIRQKSCRFFCTLAWSQGRKEHILLRFFLFSRVNEHTLTN